MTFIIHTKMDTNKDTCVCIYVCKRAYCVHINVVSGNIISGIYLALMHAPRRAWRRGVTYISVPHLAQYNRHEQSTNKQTNKRELHVNSVRHPSHAPPSPLPPMPESAESGSWTSEQRGVGPGGLPRAVADWLQKPPPCRRTLD
jgi:hypothetical protein